ncbi:MAG: Flp pilus assembly protein CpaB [Candidatus Omnitrophota bacterium]
MNRKLAIIIAIVMGLSAVVLTNIYFQQKEAAIKPEEEVPVVIAARDIIKGEPIDHKMLAFRPVPRNFIQPGALIAKEAAVGKTAAATIVAGEQVLISKLLTPERGLTLSGKTPPGKRAVTISLDATATVGGMVRPGDHVDVLASFSNPGIIMTLFQDILVLAVGQTMVADEESKEQAASSGRRDSITMALTPQEVQILSVATDYGKIRLTLRPRMEDKKALPSVDLSQLPPVVDLNTLLRLYIRGPEEQVKVPSVEIIRGMKKEMIPLPQ